MSDPANTQNNLAVSPMDRPVDSPKTDAVTDAEAEAAVSELGFRTFKLDSPVPGFRAKAMLGKYLKGLGVVAIGRSRLAIAESRIEQVCGDIDALMTQTQDVELKLGMLNLKAKLNEQLIEIAQTDIRGTAAAGDGQVTESKPLLSFPVGQQVEAVIVSRPKP
jgi:hypothetical protein